ncbi:MAG TPA: AMP-binding protein, partial [Rhodothermales bacterium]|nr:AMP-binding protein [Rhodothermales bacterium]
MTPSAHVDTFARDHLPPRDLWPDMVVPPGSVFDYPARLNCAVELLDRTIDAGHGDRPLLRWDGGVWTYREFRREADRIAHVLVDEMELLPGERVLLHGPNTPTFAAAWMAVVRAGGIVVATMPLLRAAELTYTIEKAQVRLVLCHVSCREELEKATTQTTLIEQVVYFGDHTGDGPEAHGDGLEARAAAKPEGFTPVDTAADDVVLIAFTSGTTGRAKATMHAHRDVLAICDAFPRTCLDVRPDDVFTGTPPLAFTFGLGGLLLFPMRFGASTVFVGKSGPDALLDTIQQHG